MEQKDKVDELINRFIKLRYEYNSEHAISADIVFMGAQTVRQLSIELSRYQMPLRHRTIEHGTFMGCELIVVPQMQDAIKFATDEDLKDLSKMRWSGDEIRHVQHKPGNLIDYVALAEDVPIPRSAIESVQTFTRAMIEAYKQLRGQQSLEAKQQRY